MDSIRSTAKLKIQLESDNLVLLGSASESAGCVLRGALLLTLQQPMKIKSIGLRFTGKSILTWSEPLGNGQERLYHEEEHTVVDIPYYCVARQNKLHTLSAGEHTYDFEFILRGNLPETTHVTNFYQVEYKLKAVLERPAFMPNQTVRQVVHLARQLFSPFSSEFMEPIHVVKRHHDDLECTVAIPTKVYAYDDRIPLSITVCLLHDHLQLDSFTCNLKEYIILSRYGGVDSARAHGRHLFSTRVKQFALSSSTTTSSSLRRGQEWTKQYDVVLPNARKDMHCDMDNDMVRVRHKFKFILDFHDTHTGKVMQMRMQVPIHISALSLSTHQLPAYEPSSTSIILDPNIRQQQPPTTDLPSYVQSLHHGTDLLPAYEEQPSALVC